MSLSVSSPAKKEGKKPTIKAPKIQRLVTPVVLQRKRHLRALKVQKKWKLPRLLLLSMPVSLPRAKEQKEKRHKPRLSLKGD